MRAVVKYPGSKWSLAEWIISRFPAHHSYLEPFFGSGAVLFNKSRSNIETVNDLDGNVVNLFRWIKNDPEKLAHELVCFVLEYLKWKYKKNKGKTKLDFNTWLYVDRAELAKTKRAKLFEEKWKNDREKKLE